MRGQVAIRHAVRTAAVTTGVIAAVAVPTSAAVAAPTSAAIAAPGTPAATRAASSSVSPAPKSPAPKSDRVRITMPDGRLATLRKDGPRADIAMPNGNRLGHVDAKNPSVHNDGWTYKIVRDGRIAKFVVIDGRGGGCSWVYDFRGRLIEKYSVDRGEPAKRAGGTRASAYREQTMGTTVPLGSVQAGAQDTAQDVREVSTPLVVAGGALAAAGAAGFGFAFLRRRGDAEATTRR